MRVLVDYRPALRAKTGAGNYVHELVRAYTARHSDEVTIFSSSWKDRVAADVASTLRVRVADRRVPVRALHYLWHRHGWPPVESLVGPTDVVHAAHPLLIPSTAGAQVVTVHDLYFLEHPGDTRGEIRRDYGALAEQHARQADAVVTSSKHTRDRVVGTFGLDPVRVHVVRPGAPTWATLGRAPNTPRDGYVLFIGTVERRKNLGVVLDAIDRLSRTDRPLSLVIAGAPGVGGQAWLDRVKAPPLNGYATYRGFVSDSERESLYRGARVVVLPSWDEGFGLPALEAMAAGIPVVVSDRGALPEVVGAAGIVLPPDQPEAWADALHRVSHDGGLATQLGEAGLARARDFRWQDAADALRVAYLDALAHRQRRR